jgi:hypothetical protein
MLKIRRDIVESINAAQKASDLYKHLQGAIELEHATIPAYLQALYSIKYGANTIVAEIIQSIVREEMLHMTIASNVLNAIGGAPQINHPGFIPIYPGPMPMNVHEGLQIGLAPLSKPLVEKVFMEIERPEIPQDFPNMLRSLEAAGYATVGLFYAAIAEKIKELGNKIFTGNPADQVAVDTWFPASQLFAIRDVASAVHGIEIIVDQGEGTKSDPFDLDGEPAHYYRFAEILNGRRLIFDPTVEKNYSYTGEAVPFDPAGIWDLVTDPKTQNYAVGSTARAYAERFNVIYTNLLNGLHVTFNGQPDHLSRAIGGMYELRLAAQALFEITDNNSGKYAAPTFEYSIGTT